MATICPIAALAVAPIALAHGDVLGVSGTGWTYTIILMLTSGIAAQGLLVYAQKTIQIGTIGIAQQAQPALAVVWSFLNLQGWPRATCRERSGGLAPLRLRAANLRSPAPE
jgi:drug/metabolite transporter (DMT)-like permease